MPKTKKATKKHVRKTHGTKTLAKTTLAKARKKEPGRYPLPLLEKRARSLVREVMRRGGSIAI